MRREDYKGPSDVKTRCTMYKRRRRRKKGWVRPSRYWWRRVGGGGERWEVDDCLAARPHCWVEWACRLTVTCTSRWDCLSRGVHPELHCSTVRWACSAPLGSHSARSGAVRGGTQRHWAVATKSDGGGDDGGRCVVAAVAAADRHCSDARRFAGDSSSSMSCWTANCCWTPPESCWQCARLPGCYRHSRSPIRSWWSTSDLRWTCRAVTLVCRAPSCAYAVSSGVCSSCRILSSCSCTAYHWCERGCASFDRSCWRIADHSLHIRTWMVSLLQTRQ